MLYFLGCVKGTPYKSLGCWKYTAQYGDSEPKSDILDGNYKSRTDTIRKCYEATKGLVTHFSIFDGGKCLEASSQYSNNGMSSFCGTNGTGSPSARNVYIMIGRYFEHIIDIKY